MSHREQFECDRCDATVMLRAAQQPRPFQIVLEDEDAGDNGAFESCQRKLCSSCEEDLLAWIDEGDIDRSECADLPHVDRMGKTLEELGEELKGISHELAKHNNDHEQSDE